MTVEAVTTSPSVYPSKRVQIFAGDDKHAPIWIDVAGAPWSEQDRAAWHWPQRISAGEWAEKYRYLTKSAIPGRWRNDNAPYLRGVMHLANCRGVVRLVVKKAAQLGFSEMFRTLMGYWAWQDPSPIGLALPNKEKGREIIENDVLPFFRDEFGRHPELRGLISDRLHDMKKGQIKLTNGFLLYLMWAGSPASMAANPMKRAGLDEADKVEGWAGNDADPVTLIEKRLRTYPDSLLFLNSTPTNSNGVISIAFDACHYKLYYLVPCPHCGVRQRLLFGEGGEYGIRISDEVRGLWKEGRNEAAGALAQQPGHVWYQCVGCKGRIEEREKREAARRGAWGTVGADAITAGPPAGGGDEIVDAEKVKIFPAGSWVGVQIGSQYCCWESWTMAHVAAEFLQARTLAQKFGFRTSTLGETWADQVETMKVEVLDERVAAARLVEGVLPKWTGRVIGVVDTQKDHFWLVIRAWGPDLRSARVWHGKVQTFAELEQWCWKTPWKNEDGRLPARICDKVFIDSGGTRNWAEEEFNGAGGADKPLPSRVMEVYAWALANRALVQPIKGDAHPEPGKYSRRTKGNFVHMGNKHPVPLLLWDVHHFQDQLADLMGKKAPLIDKDGVLTEEPAWQLNTRDDPEYARHLVNMHKVTRPGRQGSKTQAWEPKREGLRVDYRAIEGYQVAAAFEMGVHLLPDYPTFMATVEAALQARAAAAGSERQDNGMRAPDGRAFVASDR